VRYQMKMNEKAFGKETSESGGNAGWIKLVAGDNKVRIVSDIHMAFKHRLQTSNGWKQFVCPKAMNDETCPVCNQAEEWATENEGSKKLNPYRYTKVFMVAVIDRKDSDLKILEKGKTIFEQLNGFIQTPDYCPNGKISDLKEFDVNIKRTGEGLDTKYQVLPMPKAVKLTKEELELIEKGMPDFSALSMPKTDEQIRDMLGMETTEGVTPKEAEEIMNK